ncbi:Predicted amidohydrolase [Cohaesibacter sp. ES.047]|uniref:carbon-nitrogen hydrolase family protein n=1 Tax=Cohaesibacter sp. ES.047 TaxID=1798205 RepID=UPI000BB6CFEF|nr:carbon-nitrogen hydrolase family protein [Cohaesibacter sp. ES.047]SNY92341.1 Predicted amidohydrolase [Cohaesibacter sp. ES.047]
MTAANSSSFRAACVQLRSGRERGANLDEAERLIRDAARDGADYVQTPEQTATMEMNRKALMAAIGDETGDEGVKRVQALAKELGIWLHIGSMSFVVSTHEGDKAANRSLLIAPAGEIAARYDKIHMFDVDLENGESYRESASFQAGTKAVAATLPWGTLGMTICYDLRFPYLYRALCQQKNATLLAVPSAFTKRTGEAHWHVLLRSRAIEHGAFVFAAAQGGEHENGRKTYGHSLIIDPWGRILAEAEDEPCFIAADINMGLVAESRGAVPSLKHDKAFEI